LHGRIGKFTGSSRFNAWKWWNILRNPIKNIENDNSKFNLKWKNTNYSRQVREGTFIPIFSFCLLKIIQNVEKNMVNKRKQLRGRLLQQWNWHKNVVILQLSYWNLIHGCSVSCFTKLVPSFNKVPTNQPLMLRNHKYLQVYNQFCH